MRALICGAGIAGLALAQRLDSIGWDVTVVEKAAGPRTQGYMIDFFGLGYDAAERMGVLPRLTELGYRVAEFSYVDSDGHRTATVSYPRFTRALGGRMVSIMRPDLELALREQVADRVDLRFGLSIDEIDNRADGVRVTLTGGSVVDADLLVGADGVHSRVRRLAFGEEHRFLRYLGMHTAAYTFTDSELHERLGDSFCLTDTTGAMLGLYGLRQGRVAAFTVHHTPDPTLPQDPRTAIRDTYGRLGWVAPRALARCPEPEQVYYDQVAQVEMPEWSRGRVVLVGDACHAVSLLAGQGASLGIAGAYALGEQLRHTGHEPGGIARALAGYQAWWRPVVTAKQVGARRNIGWFLPASASRRWWRRVIMKLAAMPVLDRAFGDAVVGKTRVSIDAAGVDAAGVDAAGVDAARVDAA